VKSGRTPIPKNKTARRHICPAAALPGWYALIVAGKAPYAQDTKLLKILACVLAE
jgi:hypothetical protein